MYRRTISLLATALLLPGLCGAARADDRAEIAALYGRLEQALKNKTPEDTLALETPDFRSIPARGKPITGKQLVQEMRQRNAAVTSIKDVSIKLKSVKIEGKRATATTDFSYAVMMEDKDGHMGPRGGTHEMSMTGIVSNDLVKTPAGWKFKTMREGIGKMLVDGKTVGQPPTPSSRKTHR